LVALRVPDHAEIATAGRVGAFREGVINGAESCLAYQDQ